jgi:predicted 3-demethylubiquinone-9 3-methyltransferase (glyoxalase superfamily)
MAIAKNTICLWYDKDAEAAARFYADTFPDSSVSAVHHAPADYPSGKAGDVLTVEFTVVGIPCLGLNGGPAFKHSEAFSFQIATDDQEETDRYWSAIVGKRMRLVQGQMGYLLADHAARADRGDGCRRRRSKARVQCDDDHEEDRRRRDREGTAGLTVPSSGVVTLVRESSVRVEALLKALAPRQGMQTPDSLFLLLFLLPLAIHETNDVGRKYSLFHSEPPKKGSDLRKNGAFPGPATRVGAGTTVALRNKSGGGISFPPQLSSMERPRMQGILGSNPSYADRLMHS